MGFSVILAKFFSMVLAKFFSVVSWPSFNLVYPLCVSIWAIESESNSRNRQCLAYWVFFGLITTVELALGEILEWFPYWPYAKGMATFLLVMPYFGGSSYVYKRFVRPYIAVHLQLCDILFLPSKKENVAILSENNNILDESETYFTEDKLGESEEFVFCQGKFEPGDDIVERDHTWPASQKIVQKEWSCALCQVSTTSENCLDSHLGGKKHKAKEEELRVNAVSKKKELKLNVLATKPMVNSRSLLNKAANGMVLLENFNQIPWVKLQKWSNLLASVATPIIWCRWKRPELGWTKLNTDGSIDRKNAGFGGLLRDQNGDPICAYFSKAPRDDIFLVELWAVWRGLVLASSLGIKVIWVESDSLSVVKTINRKQPYSPKAGSCLKHIWKLLKKFEMYKVSHAWRETNRAADHLAKMHTLGSDVVMWPVDFPNSLNNIIKDDAQGRWYRRV